MTPNFDSTLVSPTTHGRMTPVVGFELPITNETIDALLAAESDPNATDLLSNDAIAPELLDVIRQELSDEDFRFFAADAGRGASGYAVAMEVVRLVAEFGGAIAAVAAGVKLTKRIYGKLRDHLGHAPTISLGTACFLAAADLIERAGHEDFSLHGAGDTRRIPPDYSYTGNDCFYVIFQRQNDLYFYAVDAYGKLTFLGTAQMPLLY